MSQTMKLWMLPAALALLLSVGHIPWQGHPQASAQVASFKATAWDYQTASVEAGNLNAKLLELGRDGWEAFAIVSSDAVVDNAPDGKPHLTTLRFEVTAKRPKAN
jgi:hypothetical protein